MTYRDETREVSREATWTFWKFVPLFLVVIAVLGAAGFAMHSAGIFGRTVVERKVFENSYQRTESIKASIVTDEAALAEIEMNLQNANLDVDTRTNLETQASAIRIRLNAAKERMK